MNEQERRAVVRRRYDARCGYCSVHEAEAGSGLDVDHFQPRAAGGGDDLDNLVYCCAACNRFKGDFWPAVDSPTAARRLLHPGRDDLTRHLHEESDGRMVALTETATFHLARLRLNRPPLVALRQARREVAHLREELTAAQAAQVDLHARIVSMEQDLQDVLTQLARLLES